MMKSVRLRVVAFRQLGHVNGISITHTHSNNIGTASTHAAVAVLVMSLIPITRSKKQPSEALALLTAINTTETSLMLIT